ncbi:YihY/virulence factor BrkB family protein [Nitratiruptor sp. SB155-2]|uniref:YihY/virulence factor BrkB family protein n=1 Tax=Nitratiruptor sp. (strain SB155-2) TaxID=387092 RepID=UPI0001586E40|nr:YihY/virulence factor BrkB family protein [Nitratiruptor sp. SB155-2]BAF69454.1 ribonuclease BN [Nitratiruptor sp. SB155-2]
MNRLKELIKTFYDPDISLYAASLSFYTIFSIVPLLLVFFTIFTKLPSFSDYYGKLKHFIFTSLIPTQQETLSAYLDTFLQNSSKLGIIGFVFVLFASIMFFQNYEYIVNKIFKSRPRSFWDSITTYWTLMTLAPIGLALSFYLSTKIQHTLNSYQYTNWIDFLSIFPYLIIWAIFFITYKISSTTWIHPKAALYSSFIASLVWDIGKNLFVYYVIYSKTYATLYGSFSAILFFFLWIYISWQIFLYGLKLCYLINQKYSRNGHNQDNCPSVPDSQERSKDM